MLVSRYLALAISRAFASALSEWAFKLLFRTRIYIFLRKKPQLLSAFKIVLSTKRPKFIRGDHFSPGRRFRELDASGIRNVFLKLGRRKCALISCHTAKNFHFPRLQKKTSSYVCPVVFLRGRAVLSSHSCHKNHFCMHQEERRTYLGIGGGSEG